MKNRSELIATFIIGYLVLLSICVLFYFIFATLVELKLFSEKFDQATIITNLLIWSATLYAPVVAYMAFDNWREQTNKQMLSGEAKELWKVFVELDKYFLGVDENCPTRNKEYIPYDGSDYSKYIIEASKKASQCQIDLGFFFELSKEYNIDLYIKANDILEDYKKIITASINRYKNIDYIYNKEKLKREEYIKEIQNIKEHLLLFVLV